MDVISIRSLLAQTELQSLGKALQATRQPGKGKSVATATRVRPLLASACR